MSRDLAGHGPLQPALWFWKLARTAPPRREAQGNDPRRDDDHLFQDALSPQTLALTGCVSEHLVDQRHHKFGKIPEEIGVGNLTFLLHPITLLQAKKQTSQRAKDEI